MIPLVVTILGFVCVALALTLARREFREASTKGRVAAPFGDAIASLMAWIAFAGLLVASLYRYGVLTTIILAGGPFLAGRLAPTSLPWDAAYPYKLALSVAGVVSAIAALLGLVIMIEGAILDA